MKIMLDKNISLSDKIRHKGLRDKSEFLKTEKTIEQVIAETQQAIRDAFEAAEKEYELSKKSA